MGRGSKEQPMDAAAKISRWTRQQRTADGRGSKDQPADQAAKISRQTRQQRTVGGHSSIEQLRMQQHGIATRYDNSRQRPVISI